MRPKDQAAISKFVNIDNVMARVTQLSTASVSHKTLVQMLRPLLEDIVRKNNTITGAQASAILSDELSKLQGSTPHGSPKEFRRVVSKEITTIKARMKPKPKVSEPKTAPMKAAVVQTTRPAKAGPKASISNQSRPYTYTGTFDAFPYAKGQYATNKFFDSIRDETPMSQIETAARAIHGSPSALAHARSLAPPNRKIVSDVLATLGLSL